MFLALLHGFNQTRHQHQNVRTHMYSTLGEYMHLIIQNEARLVMKKTKRQVLAFQLKDPARDNAVPIIGTTTKIRKS